MKLRFQALFFVLVVYPFATADSCDSFVDPKGRSVVDFSPPPGFIEVCSRDSLYCDVVMMMAPPTLKVLAYFAPTGEWQRLGDGEAVAVTRDLTVEQPTKLSAEKFAEIKRQIRNKEGETWDDSFRATPKQSQVLNPMKVVDEASDMISFVVGGRFIVTTEGASQKEVTAITVKTILQSKGETLSLYTHEQRDQPFDGESTITLARHWIECIRAKNSR